MNVVELGRLQKKKGALNQERELSDEEFEKYFGPSGTPVILDSMDMKI